MKKLFSVLAIAVIVVMAISCVKEVKLTGIALDKATLALKVGEEATLNVSYTPEDASDITAATWETSAPAVATVEAGKVKAVGEGSATITAKVGTFTATCQVTVTKDEEPGPGPEPEPTEPEDNWNYTPGADYQAAGNLWKPVDDAATVKYFYYHCEGTDWNGTETEATEVPFLKKTQSTYRLYYEASTGADWQNQFFMYPFDESHFIALDPSRKYKFSVTIGTNNNCNGFFKLSKYNPNGAPKYEGDCIWEGGRVALSAA